MKMRKSTLEPGVKRTVDGAAKTSGVDRWKAPPAFEDNVRLEP